MKSFTGDLPGPTKVVCLAFNYLDLTEGEKKPPLIFLKPPSAIIGNRQHIRIPRRRDAHVWPEVELAIRIGRTCRNVRASRAHRYIAAYAVANDVSQMIEGDVHLAAGKGRDTFLPLGDWFVDVDTHDLEMICLVNEKVVQMSTTALRIYRDHKAVEYISEVMTLNPGDVILTGTPAHEHYPLAPGDRVLVRVGEMSISNPVSKE